MYLWQALRVQYRKMAEYYTTTWNLPVWKCNTTISFIDVTAIRKRIVRYLREIEIPFPLPDVWLYSKQNLIHTRVYIYIYIYIYIYTHTHTHKVAPRHTTRNSVCVGLAHVRYSMWSLSCSYSVVMITVAKSTAFYFYWQCTGHNLRIAAFDFRNLLRQLAVSNAAVVMLDPLTRNSSS